MAIKKHWRPLLLGCIVGLAADCFASVDLAHEVTFSITGLDNPVEKIEFGDVNGDGFPEILATDNENVVLCTVAPHEIIFSLNIDSIITELGFDTIYPTYPFGLESVELLLDDINRDSLTDALIALSMYNADCPSLPFGPGYGLVIADNAMTAQSWQTTALEFSPYLGLGVAQAIDFTGDGYNELMLSLDTLSISGVPYLQHGSSVGQTLLYKTFPDSLTSIQPYAITQIQPLAEFDGEKVFIANSRWASWSDMHGLPNTYLSTANLLIVRNDGSIPAVISEPEPAHCTGDISISRRKAHQLCCQGNVNDLDEYVEIVATFSWSQYCVNYDAGQFPALAEAFSDLIMYRVVGVDTVEEVWRHDITNSSYANFLYHPDYPGCFFAFVNGRLTQFDGRDGSILQNNADIPQGKLFWDYPYGNTDEPRLIVLNGGDVSFYRLDVKTGLDDASPAAMPYSPALHQNYPNPFNASTAITFILPVQCYVKLAVFNILGQEVLTLLEGGRSAGEYTVTWSGRNSVGEDASSGVYLYRLRAGDHIDCKKMLLLR